MLLFGGIQVNMSLIFISLHLLRVYSPVVTRLSVQEAVGASDWRHDVILSLIKYHFKDKIISRISQTSDRLFDPLGAVTSCRSSHFVLWHSSGYLLSPSGGLESSSLLCAQSKEVNLLMDTLTCFQKASWWLVTALWPQSITEHVATVFLSLSVGVQATGWNVNRTQSRPCVHSDDESLQLQVSKNVFQFSALRSSYMKV